MVELANLQLSNFRVVVALWSFGLRIGACVDVHARCRQILSIAPSPFARPSCRTQGRDPAGTCSFRTIDVHLLCCVHVRWQLSFGDVRPHRCCVHLSPPSGDQKKSLFTILFVAKPAEVQKTRKNAASAHFRYWLHCQLASFEALLPQKKHQRSNAIVERGPFFASVVQKRYPSKLGIFHIFQYHIGQTCFVEEF